MQEKLAEAHALAIAASSVTARVRERVSDGSLLAALRRMDEDAEVIRTRCLAVERGLGDALADELLGHVNWMNERAADPLGACSSSLPQPSRPPAQPRRAAGKSFPSRSGHPTQPASLGREGT
jgi:hypothetical protein